MALQKNVVSFPLESGLDLKTSDKQVQPNKLLQIINGRFVNKGRIDKAFGSAALNANVQPTSGTGLWVAPFGDELLFTSQVSSAWSQQTYSPAKQGFETVGSYMPVLPTYETADGSQYDHTVVETAYASGQPSGTGYAYTAFVTSAGLSVVVRDAGTNSVVLAPTLVDSAGADPRFAISGNYATLFYQKSGTLYYAQFQNGALTTSGTSVGLPHGVVSTVATGNFEARAVTDATLGSYIAIAWIDGNNVYLAAWNPSSRVLGNGTNGLPAPQSVTFTTATYFGTVGLFVCTNGSGQQGLLLTTTQITSLANLASQKIQFAWFDTQEVLIAGGPWTLDTTSVGWGRMTCSGVLWAFNEFRFIYEENNVPVLPSGAGSTGAPPSLKVAHIGYREGPFDTPTYEAAGVVLCSDAWAYGSYDNVVAANHYGLLANQVLAPGVASTGSPTQPTYFAITLRPATVQAKMLPQSAAGQTSSLRCSAVSSPSSSTVLVGLGQQTQLSGTFDNAPAPVRSAVSVTLTYGAQFQSAEGGGNLHLAAGVLAAYDSNALSEHNFHLYPEPPQVIGSPVSVIRQQAGIGSNSAGAAGAKPEQTLITFPAPMFSPDGTKFGSGWMIQPGSYLTLFSQVDSLNGAGASLGYVLWFSVDGQGTAPALQKNTYTGGSYGQAGWYDIVQVAVLSTDSDLQLCQKLATAINALPNISTGSVISAVLYGQGGGAPVSGAVSVQATNSVAGSVRGWGSGGAGTGWHVNPGLPSSWCDVTGFLPVAGCVATSVPVSAPDGSLLTFPAGSRLQPGGYFVIPALSGADWYVVWFSVDGQGAAPTGPFIPGIPASQSWVARKVAVSSSDSSDAVGQKVEAVLVLDAGATTFFFNGWGAASATTSPWMDSSGKTLPLGCGLISYPVTPWQGQLASAENGVSLPQNTITLQAAPGGSGYVWIATQNSSALVNAGGTSGSNLTTCTGGAGIMQTGGAVQNYPIQPPYDVNCSGWAIEANGAGSIANCLPPGNGTLSIWQYVNVYSFVDGEGQIHRSAPSTPAYAIVNGTFKGNAGGIPTGGCLPRLLISPAQLTLSAKSGVMIETYRTLMNQSVFHRCSSTQSPVVLSTSAAPNAYGQGLLYPKPSAQPTILSLWDDLTAPAPFADTSGSPGSTTNQQNGQQTLLDPVAANPAGYWQVGVELQSAPALSSVVWHRNRLFGISSENPLQVWYSQLYIPGSQVAVGFNPPQFVIMLPEPAYALGSMDDSLVIFAESRIYRVSGSGPALNGSSAGDDFSAPQLVTTDVGCTVPNSVALTADGLVFQSAKGLYLLMRNWMVDGRPDGFGRAVDGLVLGNTVLGVAMLPAWQEVRFTLISGDVLFYQYQYQNWSRRTGWNGASCCLYNGLFTWQTPGTSALWQETPDIYLDNGSPYSMTIQTPWYKLNGMSGYGRVWKMLFLGTFQSDHILQVQIAKDYSPNAQGVVFFNAIKALGSQAPGIYGGVPYGSTNPQDMTDGSTYEFQAWIPAGLQLAEAIQFTITDIAQGVFDSSGSQQYNLTVYAPGPDGISQSIPFLFKSASQGQNTGGQGQPYQSYSIESLSLELGMIPGAKRFGPARQTG